MNYRQEFWAGWALCLGALGGALIVGHLPVLFAAELVVGGALLLDSMRRGERWLGR